MHRGSYYDSVLAIEMKNKVPSFFFNYDANVTSVITRELNFTFFSLRCWFLYMTSLAVTSSMLKTSVEFLSYFF